MKTKLCRASWQNKKGACCGAVFPSSELPKFVMLRRRQRQTCFIYYVGDDNSTLTDFKVGAVWKDDGRWNYFWWGGE